MSLAKFKAQAAEFAIDLRKRVVPFDKFKEVLGFLSASNEHSTDIDYLDLCASFNTSLRAIVNPYRHRTVLERYRETADLREAQSWLGLWVDTLETLECIAWTVPEWHRTYDIALHRVVSALVRERKDQAELVAEGWVEAATICRSWLNENPEERDTDDYRKLEDDYYFFEARAERAHGQALLDKRPRTPEAFDEIVDVFQNALANIERAGRVPEHTEVVQLKYYVALCRYRAAVMRLDFSTCHSDLDELMLLAPNTKMAHLPYFGQPEQIGVERHFLEAFKALAEGDIHSASQAAAHFKWPTTKAQEKTFRSKILGLRQLTIEILDGKLDRVKELDSVWGGGAGLGQASRFIIELCHIVSKQELGLDQARDKLLSVFPLDRFPPTADYETPFHKSILDQLPKMYKTVLESDCQSDEYSKNRLLFHEWQYAANITEYLCGVYNLRRYRDETFGIPEAVPSDFRLLGYRGLVEVLRFVQNALGWKDEDLEVLIEWLEDLVKEGRAEWTVEDRAERFLGCVIKTARFLFPHVVKVVDQQRLPDGRISVKLEREWWLPQKDMEIICTRAKGLTKGEHRFLKAPFKWRFGPRYDEDLGAAITFHPGSSFASGLSATRCCILVEGEHDAVAIGRLLNEFAPYWKANIDLRAGGGDSLPSEWQRLRRERAVIVIADADKKGQWDNMSPFWLEPDLEGLDPNALSEAIKKLWGDTLGSIGAEQILEAVTSSEILGGTVAKLRGYFKRYRRTFSLPSENDMKRALRAEISGVWIKQRKVPVQIEVPILKALEVGFGLEVR